MSFTECAMEQNIQVQSHRGNEHYSLDPYVQVRCKCVQRARMHRAVSMADAGEFPSGAAHTLYAWR